MRSRWLVLVAGMGCGGGAGSVPDAAIAAVPDAPGPTAPDATTVQLAQALSVSADPGKVKYPDDYLVAPMPATVVDPYCGITRDPEIFPADYLGAFPLPAVRGAPFPASVALSVQMKDYWKAGLNHAQLNFGCTGSLHQAFMSSLARLKQLGAAQVALVTFDRTFDATASSPAFDPNDEQIEPSELAFIGSAATSAGLSSVLYMQVSLPDEKGNNLPSAPTVAYFGALLDGYTTRVVAQAQAAQAAHIGAMTLNWIEYCMDFNLHPELVDTFAAKLGAALPQVRAAFSGKVLLVDHCLSADLTKLKPLISSVDGIIIEVQTQILTPTEDQAPTLDLLLGKYSAFLDGVKARWGGSGKPITLLTTIQSHRQFLETGWIEDTPYPCTPDCVENHLTIDFSLQAMAYEALLEAVKAEQAAGLDIAFVEPSGYWETDDLLPEPGYPWVFPNMAHTIRNKPAEAIVYQWFHH
jgi:hypothetical protein